MEEAESLADRVGIMSNSNLVDVGTVEELIKKTNKTDILVRVGPILGLLGTLIPLGPGLAALGSGDILTLAQALTIAFDTTVTGLSVGALSFLISKYKKQWYESDLIAVETVAEAELEAITKW